MTDWYTPEPFPPPFPSDFDPRDGLYEIVSVDPSGALKVGSSRGEFATLQPDAVSDEVNRAVGERLCVTSVVAEGKSGLLERLVGAKAEEPAAQLRATPLRPNDTERAFAVEWLGGLRSAGLNVEGLSTDEVLVERLRKLPFGSRSVPPLRRTMRKLLETLVGRFPQRDDSWGAEDAPKLMADLLATLAVKEFSPPQLRSVKHRWAALPPIVDAANRTLEKTGSPLRLVACEREVFPADPLGEGRDYMAELPVWLVLTASSATALQKANILRLYRGVPVPLAVVAPDPRTLRLAQASREPEAAVIPLTRSSAPPSAPPAAASVGFDIDPSNLGPPRMPCKATIRTFVPMDGTGELVTEDGISVRFGQSACKGFEPSVGLLVWLIDAAAHPLGRGFRAKVVNLTGKKEGDRLSDIEALNRATEAKGQREAALLAQFGLKRGDWYYWDQLLPLPPEKRRDLAAELVRLKKDSHVFERLFEELVTVDPKAFHEHLAELDWRTEPESLAWTNAPLAGVAFANEIIRTGRALQLRTRVEVGSVGPAHEMSRRDRSAANEIGAAMLALARCGDPSAIGAIETWAKESGVDSGELNALLVVAGWQYVAGKLQRLWGNTRAQRMIRDKGGRIALLTPSEAKCPACRDRLTCLIRAGEGIAFPLFTCSSCTVADFDPYFVEVSASGVPSALIIDSVPSDFEPSFHRDAALPSVTVRLDDAPDAIPDDIDKFDHLARIGGHPSWIQSPRHAGTCPKCSGLLQFALQIPDPPGGETWGGDGGMLYAFTCKPCRVSATFVQSH